MTVATDPAPPPHPPAHDAGRVVIDSRRGLTAPVSRWVDRFAELWDAPAGRVDDVMDLLAPDVRLVAPGYVPTVGRAAGRAAFERTLAALPDLRADVHRWAPAGEVLFLEMTFRATVGGRAVAWPNVDRVRFRGGYAVERVAYFNPTRVRLALLRSPTGWGQLRRLRWGA